MESVIKLGELLAKQYRFGVFKLEQVKNRRQLIVYTINGTAEYNCKNDDEVRNVIVNTAQEWLDEGLAKDINKIVQLIDECQKLDLKSETKKAKTRKGITEVGIKQKAAEKGIEIWREKGKVCVTFPTNPQIYKYNLSLLETAHKIGLINSDEANERYQSDDRYV